MKNKHEINSKVPFIGSVVQFTPQYNMFTLMGPHFLTSLSYHADLCVYMRIFHLFAMYIALKLL